MQPAVDRLLGISSKDSHLIPVAAHNDNSSDNQQPLMHNDIDKLKNR